MNEVLLIFGAVLFVFAIIDLKFRAIPSVFLTASIFLILLIRFENLKYGLLAGLIALSLYELTSFNKNPFGMADIKVMIMIGLLISSLTGFMLFLAFFGVGQLIYVVINLRYSKGDELPFIPMFFALYLGLALAGVLA